MSMSKTPTPFDAIFEKNEEQKEILKHDSKMSAEDLAEKIYRAHLAGQADAGVDPSHSNAQAYTYELQLRQEKWVF